MKSDKRVIKLDVSRDQGRPRVNGWFGDITEDLARILQVSRRAENSDDVVGERGHGFTAVLSEEAVDSSSCLWILPSAAILQGTTDVRHRRHFSEQPAPSQEI